MREDIPLSSAKSARSFDFRSPFALTFVGLVFLLFIFGGFLGGIVYLSNKSKMTSARETPNTAACSNNGFLEPVTTVCVCYDCFSGDSCAELVPNCTVDVSVANAGMYDEYFEKLSQDEQEIFSTTITSWYRPAYQPPFVIPAPFDTPLSKKIFNSIVSFHKKVGNYQTDGKTMILGNGSTQVIRALLYAASFKAGKPLNVYARPPYYPAFNNWASENPSVVLGMTNRTDLSPDSVVEIVTWPGNPNGYLDPPAYNNTAVLTIYDFVYYWPHSFNNIQLMDVDCAVFSMSKMSGHASSRVGWAFLKDAFVAYSTIGFFFSETFGLSVDSLVRSLRVIDGIAAQNENDNLSFFGNAKNVYAQRWTELGQIFENAKNFEIKSNPNTWFLWIRCVNITAGMTCGEYFEKGLIQGEFGNGEAGVDMHVRINLNVRSSTWIFLKERLAKIIN